MKHLVKLLLFIFLTYIFLISIPKSILIKGLNNKRNENNIERINSKLIIKKGVNSLIYCSQDTLDPFIYKIVEVNRTFLLFPNIKAEADFYKKGYFEIVCTYLWSGFLLNVEVRNVSYTFTYVLDSIETPDGKVEVIKTSRFVSKQEVDSILTSWRKPQLSRGCN